MTVRRLRVALALLLGGVTALAVVGCGSGRGTTAAEVGGGRTTSGGAAPPATASSRAAASSPEPLQLLPRNAFAVVDVDVDGLRHSSYYPEALRWFLAQTSIDPARRNLAHRVLDATGHVVIGALRRGPAGDRPGWLVVTRGRYEPGELRQIMNDAAPEAAEIRTVAGHPAFVSGDLWAAELAGPTWLFGDARSVRNALEHAGNATADPSPLDRPELRAMAARVGFGRSTVTAVADVPPALRSKLGDGRWFAAATGRALRTAGIRLALEQNADMRLVIGTADGPSAVVLARRLVQLRQWAERNLFITMFGLRPLLEATQVQADGSTDVVLHLQLEDAEVRSLMTRLESLASQALEARTARRRGGATATARRTTP